MAPVTEVVVVRTAQLLAEAVAARLVTRLVDVQATTGEARVLLDASPETLAALSALAGSPAREAVDEADLQIWWADSTTASGTRPWDELAGLPGRIQWGAPDRLPCRTGDLAGQAEDYARRLTAARRAHERGPMPVFDVAVLGLRPDAGVAGLAPESPNLHDARPVLTAPGPRRGDPSRVVLGLAGLSSADEVWLLATGENRARAAQLTLSGAGPLQVPAGAVHGRRRTIVLLDEAAARRVPAQLRRLASP